jgi:succinoglycan biosynthesis protein ExoM
MTPTSDMDVTVAICTFRRAHVFETIKSIEKQVGIHAYRVGILVIDNDESDALRAEVELAAKTCTLPLEYVHAPSKNISIARNAALDNVRSKWLLFIDDDELASPHWLSESMKLRDRAEVVVGRVEATYGDTLAPWVARCDFHSTRLEGTPNTAYAGNALLNLDFIQKHDLRFDLALGKTGGEDTIFFRELSERSGRIVYAPDALVYEPVPEGRATMDWIKLRKFRAGQTHGLVTRTFDPSAFRTLAFSAGIKSVVSGVMALLTLPGTDRSRKWWARAHLHAGAVAYRFRPTIHEEYG